jgi:hypothetical protein
LVYFGVKYRGVHKKYNSAVIILPAVVLKYLALASMLADHIYKTFGIDSAAMAIFGRLALPLFCWLSSVGFRRTRSRMKYLGRLFVCAIISEIPFDILWRRAAFDFSTQNVGFTLFLGGLSCVLYDGLMKNGGRLRVPMALAAAAAPIALAGILHTDYGWFGAALLFFFFVSDGNKTGEVLSVLFFDVALVALRNTYFAGFMGDIEHYCLLSLPFILTASGKKGVREKKSFFGRYYFYIFYPLHMALLALVRWVFQMDYIL